MTIPQIFIFIHWTYNILGRNMIEVILKSLQEKYMHS